MSIDTLYFFDNLILEGERFEMWIFMFETLRDVA